MFRFLVVFLISISGFLFSQKISGTITDEEGNPLPATLVFNLQTEQKSYTDLQGSFSIDANQNEELRFIRPGFDRFSKIISSQDFNYTFQISLFRTTAQIEEIEISQQPTGNLTNDSKNYGDKKAVAKLKSETAKYIRSESTKEVLAPKAGEFIQPVAQGFFIGGPDPQWDDVDFMQVLIMNLGNDFFTNDLHLKLSELQPFIYYVFRNFERKEILFYGICSQYDLSRFINESYLKIDAYKKNLPNNPALIKKKRR